MKKYSNKHLESVPPEFIVALEETLKMVIQGDCGCNSCPTSIIDDNYLHDSAYNR